MTGTGKKRGAARLPGERRWIAAGLFVVLAVFGAGGAWAVLTHIYGAVVAPGSVSMESGIKTIQHPYGGVVKRIAVREGQSVRAGDLLLELEDETLRSSLLIAERKLDAALAELARLEAERDGRREPDFSPLLLARKNVPEARKAMEAQRALLKARRRMMSGQESILKQKAGALQSQIRGLQAELEGKKQQDALIGEEVKTVETLLKKGQALRPRLLSLQRRAAALKGEQGRILEEIARSRQSIAEISMQIVQLRRDMLARVLNRLSIVQTEAENLRAKLAELRKKLKRVEVRSPVNGRVLDMTIHTVGGVVLAGKPVMRIVPEGGPIILETRVRPVDIDQVSPSQPVRVSFSAFSRRTAPQLKGHVSMISPAPLVSGKNGAPYYRVDVKVEPEELARLGGNRLVPGMPVEVYIRTVSRTPLDILISPLRNSIRTAFRSD